MTDQSDKKIQKTTPQGGAGKTSIDKVDAAPAGPEGPHWVRVLEAFNPLGPAVEMYAKTLTYRLESKRLAIELERVREQAAIHKDVIDKSFRLKMEELEHRRIAIERYFDTVQQQLAHLHVERMTVLQAVDRAMQKTLEPGIDLQERRLYKELVAEMTSTLPQFADRANQSLQALVQALPPVRMPDGLLTD